jgi:hypothetical protein
MTNPNSTPFEFPQTYTVDLGPVVVASATRNPQLAVTNALYWAAEHGSPYGIDPNQLHFEDTLDTCVVRGVQETARLAVANSAPTYVQSVRTPKPNTESDAATIRPVSRRLGSYLFL